MASKYVVEPVVPLVDIEFATLANMQADIGKWIDKYGPDAFFRYDDYHGTQVLVLCVGRRLPDSNPECQR